MITLRRIHNHWQPFASPWLSYSYGSGSTWHPWDLCLRLNVQSTQCNLWRHELERTLSDLAHSPSYFGSLRRLIHPLVWLEGKFDTTLSAPSYRGSSSDEQGGHTSTRSTVTLCGRDVLRSSYTERTTLQPWCVCGSPPPQCYSMPCIQCSGRTYYDLLCSTCRNNCNGSGLSLSRCQMYNTWSRSIFRTQSCSACKSELATKLRGSGCTLLTWPASYWMSESEAEYPPPLILTQQLTQALC